MTPATEAREWSVLVIDLGRYQDPEGETLIEGFPTYEQAREYARRRTRASIEEVRGSSSSHDFIKEQWMLFGESCLVVGEDYRASEEVDWFIWNRPGSPDDLDWKSLEPLWLSF